LVALCPDRRRSSSRKRHVDAERSRQRRFAEHLFPSAPTAGAASGAQTFRGAIVASGVSGERTVITTVVVATGVFNGVGRIVEVPNLPGDPDSVERDDLVFKGGSMHLLSTVVDVSLSVDQHTCVATVDIQQTGEITGGTGRFANATGSSTATVSATALLARNPDKSCSLDVPPLFEVDRIASNGTLSY